MASSSSTSNTTKKTRTKRSITWNNWTINNTKDLLKICGDHELFIESDKRQKKTKDIYAEIRIDYVALYPDYAEITK